MMTVVDADTVPDVTVSITRDLRSVEARYKRAVAARSKPTPSLTRAEDSSPASSIYFADDLTMACATSAKGVWSASEDFCTSVSILMRSKPISVDTSSATSSCTSAERPSVRPNSLNASTSSFRNANVSAQGSSSCSVSNSSLNVDVRDVSLGLCGSASWIGCGTCVREEAWEATADAQSYAGLSKSARLAFSRPHRPDSDFSQAQSLLVALATESTARMA